MLKAKTGIYCDRLNRDRLEVFDDRDENLVTICDTL
jgi:hypothetical protein